MHDLKNRILEIPYSATPRVRDLIAGLGRTEDLRFSPDNRRMAVAGFRGNRIVVFDISIATTGPGRPSVSLTGGVEISSPALKYPHGHEFLDDETLIVSNRAGDVAIFALPRGNADVPSHSVHALHTWPSGKGLLLNAPGSICADLPVDGVRDVLVSNNNGHTVSRHRLSWRHGTAAVTREETLIAKWMDIPDGVAASHDGRWLAVSNHHTHSVLVYERTASLGPESDPEAILPRVLYPHGLRFTPDGRHLLVTDAGAPYVHVYAQGEDGWCGVRNPSASVRVMDEESFRRGHKNLEEGGPKGIDIDYAGTVMAVTSEHQPLAFFEMAAVLRRAQDAAPDHALDMRHELFLMDEQRRQKATLKQARASLAYTRGSMSWRVTAPLRRLHTFWQSLIQAK